MSTRRGGVDRSPAQPTSPPTLDGDVQTLGASVAEGRMFAAAGEAIAGQALMDALGVRVGGPLRLIVDGKALDLRTVGRYVETSHDGKVILFGLDASRAQVDPATAPTEFLVRTAPGTYLPGMMDRLGARAAGWSMSGRWASTRRTTSPRSGRSWSCSTWR